MCAYGEEVIGSCHIDASNIINRCATVLVCTLLRGARLLDLEVVL